MIILDLSGTFFASLMAQLSFSKDRQVSEDMLRHIVLNVIRSTKMKLSDQFGELVLAVDDRSYWRKDVFPYYKANRAAGREADDLDWPKIFEIWGRIKEEISTNLPYRFVVVEKAEADDVIAVLAKKYHTAEPVVIVSRDKDFKQLHYLPGLKQWDPIKKKWITVDDPKAFLFDQIVRGDAGDGVPSVYGSDLSLVDKKGRKKPITTKQIEKWSAGLPEQTMLHDVYRNFVRNRQLIDLNYIPENIAEQILAKYETEEANRSRSKLFNYLVKNRLTKLLSSIQDF